MAGEQNAASRSKTNVSAKKQRLMRERLLRKQQAARRKRELEGLAAPNSGASVGANANVDADAQEGASHEGRYMSKAKRRRFEKFVERCALKEEREKIMQRLGQTTTTSQLFVSSAHMSNKTTRKAELRRALDFERHGINLPATQHAASSSNSQPTKKILPRCPALFPSKAKNNEPDSSSSETQDDHEDEDDEEEEDEDEEDKSVVKTAQDYVQKIAELKPTSVVDISAGEFNFVELAKRVSQPLASTNSLKPKVYEVTRRPREILEQRLKLPVCQMEAEIVEKIMENPVVVLCGETGSGKTTQVPQFLFEAGFSHPKSEQFPGLICVTQPRRVAAVAMATRVGQELCRPNAVSYQIRFEKTVTPHTRVHFMTDGVLLNELATDFLLSKYSVVILDEAHERNLNTDILIGYLSRVVKLRNSSAARAKLCELNQKPVGPLKLIIMSATLRVSDFTENTRLFSVPPPVINVQARQYPVTIHFNRTTPSPNYVLAEAFKKVCQIHSKLPPGGILVFLTGQSEIYTLLKQLKRQFKTTSASDDTSKQPHGTVKSTALPREKMEEVDVGLVDETTQVSDSLSAGSSSVRVSVPQDSANKEAATDDAKEFHLSDSEDDEDEEGDSAYENLDDEEEVEDVEESKSFNKRSARRARLKYKATSALHVLPLYALLSGEKQLRVFDEVPEGSRLCVLATNVAETSITIPGIRYVVDCGKVKEKKYEMKSGIESFKVVWTSQASADQRAGRAGRTGPGHCYRLYSSAVYDYQFEKFSEPEILRMPIESVVLRLKAMSKTPVENFPFPTFPRAADLASAVSLLTALNAVSPQSEQITKLGTQMSMVPIHPRFSRMLLRAIEVNDHRGLLEYAVGLVSALCVGELFISADEANEEYIETGEVQSAHEIMQTVIEKFCGRDIIGDPVMYLSLVGAFANAKNKTLFCRKHRLRQRAMENVVDMYNQLFGILQSIPEFPAATKVRLLSELGPPDVRQRTELSKLVLAGFPDHIAFKHNNVPAEASRFRGVAYQSVCPGTSAADVLLVDRTSVLCKGAPPELCVFVRLVRGKSMLWMRVVTRIQTDWVRQICPQQLDLINRLR